MLAQFISAAGSMKLLEQNKKLRVEKFPIVRLCSSPSKAYLMKRARRRVNTRFGRIAMFRSIAGSTCRRELNRKLSGLRPVFVIAF
jgi:hypothetical protein